MDSLLLFCIPHCVYVRLNHCYTNKMDKSSKWLINFLIKSSPWGYCYWTMTYKYLLVMMTTDWFNITPTLSNKTYGTWVCACGVHRCVWLANTSQMNQGGAVSCMSCNTAVRYRHALLIPKLHKIHHFISCFYRSSWMALSKDMYLIGCQHGG